LKFHFDDFSNFRFSSYRNQKKSKNKEAKKEAANAANLSLHQTKKLGGFCCLVSFSL